MELELNKIYYGNALDIMKQMPENFVHALITDPPYNYEIIGKEWDEKESNRRINRVKDSKTLVKNIPYGSGLAGGVRNKRWYEKNRNNIVNYHKWIYTWGKEAYRVMRPGAIAMVFNSSRTSAHVQVALEEAGFYARDMIVWRRNSGIPKGLNMSSQLKRKGRIDYEKWDGWYSALRNEWEGITVVQKPLVNNYTNTLIKYQTGLFHAKGPEINGFQSNIIENIHREMKDDFNTHPTVKPLALIEKLVKLITPTNSHNIVLDPFMGSGTTALAARNNNVNWIGIEINKHYIDIANKRLHKNSAGGLSF